MSYHSLHLRFPSRAPFDGANWFDTFVGRFVKPLLGTGLIQQFWFTRYGTPQLHEVRFRLVTADFAGLRPTTDRYLRECGFTQLDDESDLTLVGDLGGSRFLSPDACNQSPEHRAQLALNLLHALAVLYVECLVGPDAEGRFRQEINTEINNPHGSIFETFHHLFCNTTDVVTEVEGLKLGDNALILESPLYADHQRRGYSARGVECTTAFRARVRF
jgi:hypothetical protein